MYVVLTKKKKKGKKIVKVVYQLEKAVDADFVMNVLDPFDDTFEDSEVSIREPQFDEKEYFVIKKSLTNIRRS